jgi:hypothetical protein
MPYQSTKHGRKVKPRRLPGYGFHWFGRDDKGVHIWGGQIGALKWGSRILGALGISLVCGSTAAYLLGAPPEAYAVFGGVGGIHSLLAYIMYQQRKRIGELATADQVSREMGVAREEVEQAVMQQGIRPRMIINGEAFFDPADLGEAATLLRAAPEPARESLLRAAALTPEDTQTLLQPASPESDPPWAKDETTEVEESTIRIRDDA